MKTGNLNDAADYMKLRLIKLMANAKTKKVNPIHFVNHARLGIDTVPLIADVNH